MSHCVAVFRQVDSSKLLAHADITRRSVQKSLVIVCNEPWYGEILKALTVIAGVFFNQNDLSDRRVLENLFEATFAANVLQRDELFAPAPSLSELWRLMDNGFDLLKLFKLSMLEVCASTADFKVRCF